MIAAPMSGSGKTTVTAGLIAALAARGLHVAPFKVGPDYIDPSYHQRAAGWACHNLDAWMLAEDQVVALLARHTQGADLALIEGVMGLFDGVSGSDDIGSAAHLARLTGTPVLLVLDAGAMARTAAALIQGLRDFDPRVRLAGVILNRVGGAGHAAIIREALDDSAGVPVVGFIPHHESLHLPERHLGLIPVTEAGQCDDWLQRVRAQVEATVDLDQVIAIAQSAAPLACSPTLPVAVSPRRRVTPTIAVARDAAFSFLYEDNLDLLRDAGAQIEFFSPLTNPALPPSASALYLCGGFPELYAAELAANESMRRAIRAAAADGMPIYAECGGLMYLAEAIVDQHGVTHRMVGMLPGVSHMTGRLSMGYRTVQALHNGWLWRAGEQVRGHEFHYSVWAGLNGAMRLAYIVLPGALQPAPRFEGAQIGTIFASYIHLHFRSFPILAERFTEAAACHSARWGINENKQV
jgi:cobyrinic acid a,c-diamide synthase